MGVGGAQPAHLLLILHQWIFQNTNLVGLVRVLFCNSFLFVKQRHYHLSSKQEHRKSKREHCYYLHLDNSTVPGNPGYVVTLDTLSFKGKKISLRKACNSGSHMSTLKIVNLKRNLIFWGHVCVFVCIGDLWGATQTYSKSHHIAEWKDYSLLLQKAEL